MKTPTSYGSENEETSFIRRVAAPDRRAGNRRHKKRVAIAAATVGLVAASGVVGYASLQRGSTSESAATVSETEQLEAQNDSTLTVPSFVSELDDAYYPQFSQLDANKNGLVSQTEYLVYLNERFDEESAKVTSSDLPDEIKTSLLSQLEAKYDRDSQCALDAIKLLKREKVSLNKDNIFTLFYRIDELCPPQSIEIPQDLLTAYNLSPATSAPETTVDVVTQGGDTETIIVPEQLPADGDAEVKLPSDQGYSNVLVTEVPATNGGETLQVPNGYGFVPVMVTDASEGAATTTSDTVAEVQTDSGTTTPVIIPDVPAADGKDVVEIPTADGGYQGIVVTKVPAPNGGEILQIPDGEGGYTEITVTEAPTTPNEESTASTVVEVPTADGGETTVIVPDVPAEDGTDIVQIENSEGDYVPTVVDVVETVDGMDILEIPTSDGGYTQVEVTEASATPTEEGPQETVVEVPTADGGETTVVIPDVPSEDGKDVVEIKNSEGDYVPTVVDVVETVDGMEILEIPTSDGGYTQVEVTEAPATPTEPVSTPVLHGTDVADIIEGLGGYSTEDVTDVTPDADVVDVPTAHGGDIAVIIPNVPEADGEVLVEIPTKDGDYDSVLVTETPAADGGKILEIPDGEGGFTPVEVASAPAEQTTEAPVIVQVPTADGGETTVIIPDVPAVNVEDVVQIKTDEGYVAVLVTETPTADGGQILEIPTGDGGYTQVEVTEAPAVLPATTEHMTKEEFKSQIADYYSEKLTNLKDAALRAELESEALAKKVKALDDCIEQAANKFGWYGVYEQAPHFSNAVDWVEHVCWAA